MKFKLDENIGQTGKLLLEAHGHDVMTVAEQGLSGAPDSEIYRVIAMENRALITLDRDFGEVLRFPPDSTAGVVVIAAQGRMTKATIEARIGSLCSVLKTEPIAGRLWIVEAGRVRVHLPRDTGLP